MYAEQIELVGIYVRRRFGHQVLRLRGLREGDDFADRLLAREQRHNAVESQRDAAVRRRSIRQRVEEETESAEERAIRENEERIERERIEFEENMLKQQQKKKKKAK